MVVLACGVAAAGACAGDAAGVAGGLGPAGAGSACWRGTGGRPARGAAGAGAGADDADGAAGADDARRSGRTAGITWVASSSGEPAEGSLGGALVSVSAGSSSKMDSPGRSLIGGASVVCWLIRARTSDVGPVSPKAHRTYVRRAPGQRCLVAKLPARIYSDATEAVDLVQVRRPLLVVADTEALLGCEAQHADLALVPVLMHVVRRLAHLCHRVRLRQRGVDPALGDQPVGLPGLAVVREVRADDALEVHPEVPVVVLVHEPARRGAGDDRAALAGGVDRGPERLPARVLEDDVDVLSAGQLADPLAEPAPLGGVLGLLVLPEPVVLGAPVDDQLRPHPPADLGLVVAGDHAHRRRATVERELGGVAAEAPARPPDQHVVALLHAGPVSADQLAVGRGVHQPGTRRLLPREVGGLGHQLVRLDQRDLGQPAEVRLEPPDPLLGVEHRVVVALGAL